MDKFNNPIGENNITLGVLITHYHHHTPHLPDPPHSNPSFITTPLIDGNIIPITVIYSSAHHEAQYTPIAGLLFEPHS